MQCAARVCQLLGRSVLPKDIEIVKWNQQRGETIAVLASEIANGW